MGYTAQILLLGVFTTLFGGYAISGELERHRLLGRIALWASLVLNWGYTGLCVYESYVAAGESRSPCVPDLPLALSRDKEPMDLTLGWSCAVSQNRTSKELISSNVAWQFLPLLSGLTGVVTQGFLTSHALVVSWVVRISLFATAQLTLPTRHGKQLIPRKALRPIFCGVMGLLIAGQMTGFTMACINGIWVSVCALVQSTGRTPRSS
jgi:hypothetical protein